MPTVRAETARTSALVATVSVAKLILRAVLKGIVSFSAFTILSVLVCNVDTSNAIVLKPTSEAVNDKAVLRSAAVNALTVLFALICINLIAFGLFNVNKLEPTVVAPRLVLPVEATKLVEPPSH